MKKKLDETNPELLSEWNYDKNILGPENYTSGLSKNVWWICGKGHEWEAAIRKRINGSRCPFCLNAKVGYGNDLSTQKPDLANQWHLTKNNDLKAFDVTPGSHKKVWWSCEKGHEWEAQIKSRNIGSGCPYCCNKKIGYGNDLQTKNPNLAKQWHPTKNGSLKTSDVGQNSNKKVWWICGKGHEWKAIISSRNTGIGCSKCSHQTSKMDKVLYFYTKKLFTNAILRGKVLNNKLEADVLIPDLKIIIEYDGYWFHKEKLEKDILKRKLLIDNGYKIFILKEEGLKCQEKDCVFFQVKQKNNSDFENKVKILFQEHLSSYLEEDVPDDFINLDRDNVKILSLYENIFIENSVAKNKRLIKEWNFKKNLNLKPETFLTGSNERVWWICDEGHEWKTMILSRKNGDGCPGCSGRIATKENNLKLLKPKIAKDWNYSKNYNLKPEDFRMFSDKKVWWFCNNHHSEYLRISSRVKKNGCTECKKIKKKEVKNKKSLTLL
jgi:very-short-patch-repair endonuclease